MNESDSMRTFLSAKHQAFNEACCAFANSENMTQVANAIGMNPAMLRNKLNPEQPHVLSCTELIAISKVSGNHTIVNSLLLGLGIVTAHIPRHEPEDSLMKRVLDTSIYSGALSQIALENAGKAQLSRAQKQKMVQTAQASISNQVLLIYSLEQRNPCACLRMATDRLAEQGREP